MATLVTGATGKIGRHLVNALLDRKEEVRILVRGENPVKVPENVEVVYGDITDKDAVRKAMYHCDTVYHLAAVVDYLAPKDLIYNVNVLGTKNVATFGRDRRVIYLSSTAVYGYKPKENPVTEKTPCKPSNFYGKTKHLAEKLILEINGIVIRSADVFGSGFIEGYDYVIKGLENGTMPLVGGGKNFIHWIHVNDLIQALLLAKDKGKPGEIYLVAGKEVKTSKECFELLCKYLGVEPPAKNISKLSASFYSRLETLKSKLRNRKPKVIPEYINKITSDRTFDITKARDELGFDPKVSYDQAAKEMVENYKNSKESAK